SGSTSSRRRSRCRRGPAHTCDSATGCIHTPNSNLCDDGSACTVNDTCSNGVCRGTLAVVCQDDGNPCTDDRCDSATGQCVHPNNFASCDDGNPCTIGDFCSNGACRPGSPKYCDDLNVCTQDVCDVLTGSCTHPAIDGPCSDNNACTSND